MFGCNQSDLESNVWQVYSIDCYKLLRNLYIDMINIFEVFLPQLLRYPNPTDPLNGEAAALLMREPAAYETKVKGTAVPITSCNLITHALIEYVQRYATKEAYDAAAEKSDEEEDEMSSIDSFSDEEAAGMEL